jgi:glycerol-3-phosphate responsive antiterminator
VKFVALCQGDIKDVKKTLQTLKQASSSICFAIETGSATKDYMLQYGVSSIPHCFVVAKNSNMIWHGHVNHIDVSFCFFLFRASVLN